MFATLLSQSKRNTTQFMVLLQRYEVMIYADYCNIATVCSSNNSVVFVRVYLQVGR